MSTRVDLGAVIAGLAASDASAWGGPPVRELSTRLTEARVTEGPVPRSIMVGDRVLGRVLPFGSVVLQTEGGARLVELDRHGHVTGVVRRGPGGAVEGARLELASGGAVGVLPGGADHPLWGAADRVVRFREGGDPEVLTTSGAVDWTAVDAIPPLADPTRLLPGTGSAILNLLAGLALDQRAGPLRYRGPYPTEQLFWTLVESFRFDETTPDPVAAFTWGGESTFLDGPRSAARPAPLGWTPAPHERLFVDGGIAVALRDGVEKVAWDGRLYYQPIWQGLRRREHRVVRRTTDGDGAARFVASLAALGRIVEDHLVFALDGELVAGPFPAAHREPEHDAPLSEPWREALAALLPLEATSLLASAIQAVWPTVAVVWGPVARDLVETGEGPDGSRIRLAWRLARAYQAERVGRAGPDRRALAHALVREILGLAGPPVRRAAAAWLEAQPPDRRAAHLEASLSQDRKAAAGAAREPLGRLIGALEAGAALPPEIRPG